MRTNRHAQTNADERLTPSTVVGVRKEAESPQSYTKILLKPIIFRVGINVNCQTEQNKSNRSSVDLNCMPVTSSTADARKIADTHSMVDKL